MDSNPGALRRDEGQEGTRGARGSAGRESDVTWGGEGEMTS